MSIVIQQQPTVVPGIMCSGPFLQVIQAYNNNSDHHISTNQVLPEFIAGMIIEREMREVEEDSPEFNPEKLQAMLEGSNPELKELAIVMLEGKTKYVGRLLRQLFQSGHTDWIVSEYISKNKTNITGRVR